MTTCRYPGVSIASDYAADGERQSKGKLKPAIDEDPCTMFGFRLLSGSEYGSVALFEHLAVQLLIHSRHYTTDTGD